MRFIGSLAIAMAGLALTVGANAQSTAQHDVTVQLPQILKLRLDGREVAGAGNVPVAIEVAGGRATITPGRTELEILANVDWQLSASYSPNGPADEAVRLQWRRDGSSWTTFSAYSRAVATGARTAGWASFRFEYGLAESHPADGSYGGTVTYTLARP